MANERIEDRDDYGAPNQHCEECRKHGICAYHRDIDAVERRSKEKPLAIVPTPESEFDDFWGFGG